MELKPLPTVHKKVKRLSLVEYIFCISKEHNNMETSPLTLIKRKVAKGRVKEAIEVLLKNTSHDEELNKQAILISAQYVKWSYEDNVGVGNNIELRRIENSVLQIASNLFSEEKNQNNLTLSKKQLDATGILLKVLVPVFFLLIVVIALAQAIYLKSFKTGYLGFIISTILILVISGYILKRE